MAVLQRVRWISNERVDLPDALNLDAFNNADWSQFVKNFLTGAGSPLIIAGFDIPNPDTYVTKKSATVLVNIANSMMFHPESTGGAGGFFVAGGSEPQQSIALTPGQTNFIELDQTSSTSGNDTRAIWDEAGGADGTGEEFKETIDTVTNLGIVATVNTVGFTVGKVSVAKVVVDVNGVITSITDSRNLMFRLGTGGLAPDPNASWGWPQGRTDHAVTLTTTDPTLNPFQGSDKAIATLKQWMNAVMTEIGAIKGPGAHWFDNSVAGGGSLSELFQDSVGSILTSKTGVGEFQWNGAGNTLTWNDDLYVQGISGPYFFVIKAGNVTLNAGDVAVAAIGTTAGQVRDARFPVANDALSWTNAATFVNGSNSGGSFAGLESDTTSAAAAGDWIRKEIDTPNRYVRIKNFYNASGGASGGGALTTAALAVSVELDQAYQGVTDIAKIGNYAKGAYSIVQKTIANLPWSTNQWWLASRLGTPTAQCYTRDRYLMKDGENRIVGYPINDGLIANVNTALAGRWSSVTIADGSTSLLGDYVGNTQAVFNSAIAALPSGGTIYVKRGTYTFASKVTISTNKIRIVGEGNELVNITGAISGDALFELTGTDCLLEQLNIANTSATANAAGVKLNGTAGTNGHNEVSHCDIYASGNPAGVTYGIRLGRDNQRYIHDCRISLLCSSGVTTAYGIGLVESDTTGSQFNIYGDRFINNTFVNVSSGGLTAEYFHIDVTANHTGAIAFYHHAVIRGNKDVGATNTLSWPVRLYSTFTAGVAASIYSLVVTNNISNDAINPTPQDIDLHPSGGGTIIDIISVGNVFGSTYLNPASTVGIRNALTAKNITKSWGRLQLNTGANPTVLDGFNLASAVRSGIGNKAIFISFPAATPMANGNYAVILTAEGTIAASSMPILSYNTPAAGNFTIIGYDFAGTQVDLSAAAYNGLTFSYLVIGVQ